MNPSMRLLIKVDALTFDLPGATGRAGDEKQRDNEERERERLDQEGVVDDVEGARVGAGLR